MLTKEIIGRRSRDKVWLNSERKSACNMKNEMENMAYTVWIMKSGGRRMASS
jgi:hypothetical protein